jgi:AraC family transcriptional regulator
MPSGPLGSTPATHGRTHLAVRERGLSFTSTTHAPHTTLPLHAHPDPALTFVVRGGFTESFARTKTHRCDELELLFKPGGAEHTNRYAVTGAHSCIIEREVRDELHESLQRVAPRVDGGALVAEALRVCAAFQRREPEAALRAEELIARIVARASVPTSSETRSRWLGRLIESARSRATTTGVTLSTLATEAGVHPVYLARVFRRHVGSSIGDFVLACRIEQAAVALIASDQPIAELAARLGFADQSHFTRRFARLARVTPARYRQTMQSLLHEVRRFETF